MSRPQGNQATTLVNGAAWGGLAAAVGLLVLFRRGGGDQRIAADGPQPNCRRRETAARRLNAGAATIAFSVLADSALEHYRGGFYRPAMYVGPAVSALTVSAALDAVRRPSSRDVSRTIVFGMATVAGLAGFGYHLYNLSRREGGAGWGTVFHAAPVGAPLGIHLAGLLGIIAGTLPRRGNHIGFSITSSGAVTMLTVLGLAGTAAETAILHFRGAFQDPYMFLPVTIPPAAATVLTVAMTTNRLRRPAATLLYATALTGIAGVGFHAYGVHRNVGGWRNWTQNVLKGPPLPAPPAFVGLALAGLAALDLSRDQI